MLNVGAGSGNYEPSDRAVIAIEPSTTMIAQRPASAAPCVRGVAEALPFDAATFDAAMAILTVHHWTDRAAGMAEMRRVAARQVVFFFEPAMADDAWIMHYWPEIRELPTEVDPPGEAAFRELLDIVDVRPCLLYTSPSPRD